MGSVRPLLTLKAVLPQEAHPPVVAAPVASVAVGLGGVLGGRGSTCQLRRSVMPGSELRAVQGAECVVSLELITLPELDEGRK